MEKKNSSRGKSYYLTPLLEEDQQRKSSSSGKFSLRCTRSQTLPSQEKLLEHIRSHDKKDCQSLCSYVGCNVQEQFPEVLISLREQERSRTLEQSERPFLRNEGSVPAFEATEVHHLQATLRISSTIKLDRQHPGIPCHQPYH